MAFMSSQPLVNAVKSDGYCRADGSTATQVQAYNYRKLKQINATLYGDLVNHEAPPPWLLLARSVSMVSCNDNFNTIIEHM